MKTKGEMLGSFFIRTGTTQLILKISGNRLLQELVYTLKKMTKVHYTGREKKKILVLK